MAEQTVELEPGESRVVTFEAIPHEAKTYHVSVDGLSGSFKAVAPPFDPWSYDFNGDGYIDKAERLQATADYYADIITKDQLNQVLALPAPPVPPPECIPHSEKLQAVSDYYAGEITRAQLDAILAIPTCP